jgi:protein subunit release factor A
MICEQGLKIETFTNMAGTYVRITHLPTGSMAESVFHTSVLAARKEAMAGLMRALEAMEGRF